MGVFLEMVSNDEIRRKLTDKREGQDQRKKNINEDATPSIEEIKKKLRKKRDNKSVDSGYLICDNCLGYYKLQSDESPDDFESCNCGGKLRYVEDINTFELD